MIKSTFNKLCLNNETHSSDKKNQIFVRNPNETNTKEHENQNNKTRRNEIERSKDIATGNTTDRTSNSR